jgi:phosphoribosylformylglycinamidine synthase
MSLLHFYRRPALSPEKKDNLVSLVKQKISPEIYDVETEYCFNIDAGEALTKEELEVLRWLLSETFEPENFSDKSFLTHHSSLVTHHFLCEVGPRMNFTTAWSTNTVSVCRACGLTKIRRIERSRRYKLIFSQQLPPLNPPLSKGGRRGGELSSLQSSAFSLQPFLALVHDRMTECPYPEPLITFQIGIKPEPVYIVPLI